MAPPKQKGFGAGERSLPGEPQSIRSEAKQSLCNEDNRSSTQERPEKRKYSLVDFQFQSKLSDLAIKTRACRNAGVRAHNGVPAFHILSPLKIPQRDDNRADGYASGTSSLFLVQGHLKVIEGREVADEETLMPFRVGGTPLDGSPCAQHGVNPDFAPHIVVPTSVRRPRCPAPVRIASA